MTISKKASKIRLDLLKYFLLKQFLLQYFLLKYFLVVMVFVTSIVSSHVAWKIAWKKDGLKEITDSLEESQVKCHLLMKKLSL